MNIIIIAHQSLLVLIEPNHPIMGNLSNLLLSHPSHHDHDHIISSITSNHIIFHKPLGMHHIIYNDSGCISSSCFVIPIPPSSDL